MVCIHFLFFLIYFIISSVVGCKVNWQIVSRHYLLISHWVKKLISDNTILTPPCWVQNYMVVFSGDIMIKEIMKRVAVVVVTQKSITIIIKGLWPGDILSWVKEEWWTLTESVNRWSLTLCGCDASACSWLGVSLWGHGCRQLVIPWKQSVYCRIWGSRDFNTQCVLK